tara:strand:+ start:322 stop:618 length:297 start_codon:yes stop_codon:yes gene_type:complete
MGGIECDGIRLRLTDKDTYQPFNTGIHLFTSLRDLFGNQEEFRTFATQTGVLGFDIAIGNEYVLNAINSGYSPEEIIDSWQKELKEFNERREQYLIYS